MAAAGALFRNKSKPSWGKAKCTSNKHCFPFNYVTLHICNLPLATNANPFLFLELINELETPGTTGQYTSILVEKVSQNEYMFMQKEQ